MNPLFNMFNRQPADSQSPGDFLTQRFGNIANMKNNFDQFRQNFSADPEQVGRNMIDSGRLSQDQANKIASLVNTFYKFLR